MEMNWDDKDMVLAAIPNMYYVHLKNLSPRLKDDLDVMDLAVEHNPNSIQYAGPKVNDDKRIVLKAVKKQGMGFLLREVSPRLKDDEDVVVCATAGDWGALEYASDRLKDDLSVVSVAALKNGRALEYVSDRLKKDRTLAMLGVTHGPDGGYGLKFLSDELKDDKKVVLLAVSNTADALRYASERLRDDPEVVTAAVMNNYCSLEHASERLRHNRNFVASLAKKNAGVLKVVDLRFVFDKDFLVDVLAAEPDKLLSNNPMYLNYIMDQRLIELKNTVGKEASEIIKAEETAYKAFAEVAENKRRK